MLNLYEPIAESGFDNRSVSAGNRASRSEQNNVAPSTAEQVLFLVESVYEIGGDTGSIAQSNLPCAMISSCRGH
ncbi:MAG: hypothetical protein ACYC64_03275 [Armatimonadota bacterium]